MSMTKNVLKSWSNCTENVDLKFQFFTRIVPRILSESNSTIISKSYLIIFDNAYQYCKSNLLKIVFLICLRFYQNLTKCYSITYPRTLKNYVLNSLKILARCQWKLIEDSMKTIFTVILCYAWKSCRKCLQNSVQDFVKSLFFF